MSGASSASLLIPSANGSYHHGWSLIGLLQSRQLKGCLNSMARTSSRQFCANTRADSMSRIICECRGTPPK